MNTTTKNNTGAEFAAAAAAAALRAAAAAADAAADAAAVRAAAAKRAADAAAIAASAAYDAADAAERAAAADKGHAWDSLPQLHNSERAILSYLASEIPAEVPNASTPLNRKQIARRLGLSSRTVIRAVQYLSAREAPARRGDVGYLPGKEAQDQPLVAKAPILLLEDQRGKPGRHRETVRIQWSTARNEELCEAH